jgi:hypothetical protein
MPRPLASCGTEAAYRRHRAAGERIDALCGKHHVATLTARRRGERGAPPATPKRRVVSSNGAVLDPVADTLANLELVKAATAAVLSADPTKLGSLSKRWSELVAELVAFQGDDTEVPADPLEALLDGSATVTPILSPHAQLN